MRSRSPNHAPPSADASSRLVDRAPVVVDRGPIVVGSALRSLRNAGLCFAASVVLACGVSDRKVNEDMGGDASMGGSSGSAGASGRSNQGGTSAGGAPTNSSGFGGDAGEAGEAEKAGGPGEAGAAGASSPGCVNDSLRCDNSGTPSKCVGGAWLPQDACPALKPACGNGVCSVAKLSGGIVTVADGVLATSTVRLVSHGLEYTQATCGSVGTQQVCVTGGIRP